MTTALTWERFTELLDQDGYEHAELVDGQVVVDVPDWLHQRIVTSLSAQMWRWVHAGEGRGEATMNPRVRITHNRGYLPDVAWYREDQFAGADRPGGPPDVAIEVLSPSTRAFDLVRKRADYARVEVGELWLIDPEVPGALVLRSPEPGAEFVVVDDLDVDGLLTSPRLPGLRIRVGDLLVR